MLRILPALNLVTERESPVGDGGDFVITAKLEACLAAVQKLPAELEALHALAAEARDEIERDAYLWKADNLKFQVERAAEIARERLEKLASLQCQADYDEESRRCAADTLYWFRYYAWGYDPRNTVLPVQPYVPYPHQEPYILWLDNTVMVRHTSGIVEKSRDEGATVGALGWIVQKWLYVPGFAAFMVSATEDLVDTNNDKNTLFGKIRFQLRLTPSWMLPEGFSLLRDMPYMNIANPANDAQITGHAPTARVGRQSRATVVLADEFQSWPGGGYTQNTAMSMTSESVIKLGTPLGTLNQYYEDTHAENANVLVLDWRDNPRKDERWYRALPHGYVTQPMTQEAIASEVDRNYEASQPGKVIKNLREEYCFITWSELIRGFEAYGLGRHFKTPGGRYVLPESWNWGRVSDYGQSAKEENDTHIWAYTLFARPSEGWPFTDTLFVFCATPIYPIGCGEEEAVKFYTEVERTLGVRGDFGLNRTPDVSDFSHEQGGETGARTVLSEQYAEEWTSPDLDFDKGRSQLVFHFNLTDTHDPNPFRPELLGRARLVYVAPDGEYQLARRPGETRYFVTPSKSQWGFKRLRQEYVQWHFPAEERGKAPKKQRPLAKFDDIATTQRYMAARWGVASARLSDWERLKARLPEHLRPENVQAAKGTAAYPELVAAASHAVKKAENEERREKEKRSQGWAKAAGRPVGHRRYKRGGQFG